MTTQKPGFGRTVLYLSAALYLRRSIAALRDAGFRVVTVDRDADAPGHALAHEHVIASISDVASVREAAREQRADVIVTGIEAGLLSAVLASSELSLPNIGVDVAERCLDKGEMRKKWLEAGLAQPDFRLTNDKERLPGLIEELGLPCVLKPRRSNGSKGVSVITEPAEIGEAIKDAVCHAETHGFIVERYIEGPLLTADGFVDLDRVEVAALGDVETQAVSRFRVNTALNYPSNFPDEVVRRAKRLIHDAVRALGLLNSPFHCECIVSPSEVMLVEIGARSGGSFLGSTIVPAVSGLIPSVLSARMLLGDRPSIRPKAAGGASLTFLEAPNGRLSAVTGLSEATALPGVLEAGVTLEVGQEGGAVASDNARHGYVVTMGRDREQAVARARQARNMIRFQMAGTSYIRS